MKLDLNRYRVNAPLIQKVCQNSPESDISDLISEFAVGSHCPLVALYFYVGEGLGYTQEITGVIDRLSKFYGYTEIINQLEGSPYLTKNEPSDIGNI
jgi:hypothetical protein